MLKRLEEPVHVKIFVSKIVVKDFYPYLCIILKVNKMEAENNIISRNSFYMLEEDAITSLLSKYSLPSEMEEKPIYITLEDGSRKDWGARTLSHFHLSLLRMKIHIDNPDNTIIQVARLALLMKSCMGGKIEIRCTISDPKKGEVKGTTKSIEIHSSFFNNHFERFLHTLISQGNEHFYTNHITNGKMEGYKESYVYGDFGFMDFWSEEELKVIIEFEQSDVNRYLTNSAKLGRRLSFVLNKLNKLNEYGLFKGMTQRKVYSFLYDWCVLHGMANAMEEDGFSGSLGKEKADWVKNRINAFHNQIKKRGIIVHDNSGVF